jgi:butyryl-CoA dehydrogenase
MGDLGLFGIPFPEEYGGGGGDLTMLCIAIEELARIDHSMAITLEAGVGLGANPIHRFGNEEQKQTWLPDLCAGRTLGGFGLTEPDAGSDAGGTRTAATLDSAAGEWVIDGEKAFITNSGTELTAFVTVTARTGPGEISAIVVPSGTPGFEVLPPYRKMGWHASDTHGLTFTGARVPQGNLLGERGRGFAQFLQILDEGRIAISALAVGCIQACLEHCTRYSLDRHAFGKPIGANQGVAFQVADLAVMAETARLLTYQAAWLHDTGRPCKQAAAMAKLHTTEAAVAATRIATQVFGGAGFIDETPVARFYRDAKILEIGEGTSEIQRLVISRELGLPVQ